MLVVTLINHHRLTKFVLFVGIVLSTLFLAGATRAQTIDPDLRPDLQRALTAQAQADAGGGKSRVNGYRPARAESLSRRESSTHTRSEGTLA